MRITRADAARRLRALAVKAAQLDGGRVANRLSAFALLVGDRSERGATMCAELEALTEQTPSGPMAEVLREACRVARQVVDA